MKGSRSRELVSRCIKAGSRVYFIDAKQDSHGHNYIVLSENRSNLKTGERERHRIFLYEEDFDKFSEGFMEVLDAVKTGFANVEKEDGREASLLQNVEMPTLEDFLGEEE